MSKTEKLDLNLLLRQYELDNLSQFLEVTPKNPKLTQWESAQQLSYSNSTFKRWTDQTKMPSPYNKKSTERKKWSHKEFYIFTQCEWHQIWNWK